MALTVDSLAQRCRRIEILVMDVDGVLTDGRVVYSDSGVETKAFHVRDGAGLRIWQMLGKRSAILTGRNSPIVQRRSEETGVSRVIQGAAEKLPAFVELLAQERMRPEQAGYVGDDIPDLPVMRNCGLAVTVPDACPEAKRAAHFVTRTAGGRGAVREVVELILRCQGLWHGLVARFEGQTLDRPTEGRLSEKREG
jgi:3-deoxy-D-manno-octulosonate 8-phosphate phosphatase (KDO 8-P phosphatase)